jgi:hypothetical protein
MKRILCLIIFLLLIIPISTYAGQVLITFKNGGEIEGEVIQDKPGDKISIRLENDAVMEFKYDEILKVTTLKELYYRPLELGLGLGPCFGGAFGANIEYYLGDNHLSLYLGSGYTFASNRTVGFNGGLRINIGSVESNFTSRLTIGYGFVKTIILEKSLLYPNGDDEAYNGTIFGIGGKLKFGDNRQYRITFDVLYINSPDLVDRYNTEKDNGYEFPGVIPELGICIGFHAAF